MSSYAQSIFNPAYELEMHSKIKILKNEIPL